jgi:hypothetical protein
MLTELRRYWYDPDLAECRGHPVGRWYMLFLVTLLTAVLAGLWLFGEE